MSRVISLAPGRARRTLCSVPLAGLLLVLAVLPIAAQDAPPCGDERRHDCVLPDWTEAEQRDIPSLFGKVEGMVWVEDEEGDAPAGGIDLLAVGIGQVDVRKPKAVRKSDDLIKLGGDRKAVRGGRNVLVRIVLDRQPDEVEADHASVHVATDIDGSRRNNSPTSIAAPEHPFAGSQDVYSLTWAATTDRTRLVHSDLARGWYKDKSPFAASWAAPGVLDMLIAPSGFGEDFRVVSHVAADDGGYDEIRPAHGDIPVDARVGLVPACLEGSISAQPFVVRTLVENGQGLRNVETPASWRGGARIPLDDEIRPALEALIAEADEDGDGRIAIRTWVNLFEDGLVIRQRPTLEVAVEGDHALLALELGLTRRGFNVLRDFEPEATGDERVDAWLERATDALRGSMPPFRSTKRAGLVAGEGIGACVSWLAPLPEPLASEVPDATGSAGPATPPEAATADA